LSMTPVDVTAVDVGAFPGLFEGNAGTVVRGALRSYGTAELLPQQGGQRLNLAPGKTAVIELPLYARSQPDGSPIRPGDAIPLWSLDPATGVWQHEGDGTVVAAAASPSGLAVRATISHFSWWNLDAFSERATVNLTVTANGEALPAATAVSVQANVLSGTGPTWAASSSATLGVARDYRVAAPATLRFSAKAEAGTLSCEGATDVSVDPGDSAAAAIDLTCAEVPQPRIVRPAGFTVTNAGSAMSLLVEIAGKVPDKVELLVNGAVVAETGPQFFYSFAWDNRSVSDGLYELTARATLNGLTRTSPALQVKVDRAPPSVTRVLPATTQAVSRATEFSVSFDEEVSPLPFEWTDAVRLSVTPQGQTTPQQVDADIAYDAETRRLTVRARVDLPPGTAGLNWGGVRDLAGNNVGSQVGATWPVDVAAPVGASLLHVGDPQSMPAVPVVAADGSRYIAHRPNGNVTVSRHDAASDAWVALAPAANERPTHRTLAFALDSTGVPHVAFTQQRENDATRYELVLKRLVGNAWETAAPAVPVAGTSANSMSEGSLVFDTADRPIVALTDADGALQILRLEAGVLVSLAPAVPRWAESGLALQADGTPVVAVIQSFLASNAKSLCINRLVAGAWQRMSCPDSVPDATQQLTWARLALRGDEPWVAYGKFSQNTGAQVLVARHDLTMNAAQAVALPAPVLGNTADITAVGDQILVAVPQVNGPAGRPILVQHWVAGTWTSPFNVANVDSILRLRFATQGNAVVLALAGRTRAYLNVLHLP